MSNHFCTCEDYECPFNPQNGAKNCDLCIKKNLAKREIPSCFFRSISNDIEDMTNFSYESFANFLKKHS